MIISQLVTILCVHFHRSLQESPLLSALHLVSFLMFQLMFLETLNTATFWNLNTLFKWWLGASISVEHGRLQALVVMAYFVNFNGSLEMEDAIMISSAVQQQLLILCTALIMTIRSLHRLYFYYQTEQRKSFIMISSRQETEHINIKTLRDVISIK